MVVWTWFGMSMGLSLRYWWERLARGLNGGGKAGGCKVREEKEKERVVEEVGKEMCVWLCVINRSK